MTKRKGTVRRPLSLHRATAQALSEAVTAEKQRRGAQTDYGIESELADAAIWFFLACVEPEERATFLRNLPGRLRTWPPPNPDSSTT